MSGAGEGTATRPDQLLWRSLVEATGDKEFCSAWLQIQAGLIANADCGLVVVSGSEGAPFAPMAVWPPTVPDLQRLAPAIDLAIREEKGVVLREEESGDTSSLPSAKLVIAYPFKGLDRICGVAVFRIAPRAGELLTAAMRQLQWGTAWLSSRMLNRDTARISQSRDRISAALDLVAIIHEEDRFSAAATAFVTLLANRLGCERVSIGFMQGRHAKVLSVSHTAQFKERMNLIKVIASVMEEAVDQRAVLLYPEPDDGNKRILLAHTALAAQHDSGAAICTVPFIDRKGEAVGALVMEREAVRVFDQEAVELCECVAALAAPILQDKRSNDRFIAVKIWQSFKNVLQQTFGAGHLLLKASAIAVIAVMLVLTLVKGEYRVSAKSTMEGAVQIALVAPFDGFIATARVRAGDLVKQGQVLCTLDDRDLKLQRVKLQSQREQATRQYREAMGSGNRASMRIFREQLNQAETQLRLVEDHLARTVMRAPFDGVVVSGDLSQSLGAPVERSKLLFEVAPLRDYRVKLQVDEHDMNDVAVGMRGELLLNSLPETTFPIVLRKITPVTGSDQGKSYFQVEASLEQNSERIRPGMEGIGKISAGQRSLGWIWLHDVVNWLRLCVWSWWP